VPEVLATGKLYSGGKADLPELRKIISSDCNSESFSVEVLVVS
jgi:hypothetical protein